MSKRKDGSGALYHWADGRWEAQFRLAGGGRKSVYGRTRREVLSKLREVRWTVSHGVPVSSRKLHLGGYLEYWLDMTKSRVRPSTFRNCELNVERLAKHLAQVPLADLSPAAIQETYRRLKEQGLSAYSVLQAHRTMNRALTQAFHWGLIRRNPAALVFPPRPKPRPMTALAPEELRQLLNASCGDPLHPLLVVLGTAGLRLGEALALTWDDLDLDQGRLAVRRTLQAQRGVGLVFGAPKTRTSNRTVVLTQRALRALRDHRIREAKRQAATARWQDTGLVFANRSGGPLHQSRANQALARALERAGLPRIRVHDLRHTAVTALLVLGVHPKLVHDFLGHSSIKTTLDTYSHVMPTIHDDAIRRLDLILGDGGPADDTGGTQPSAA
jgi:integrase